MNLLKNALLGGVALLCCAAVSAHAGTYSMSVTSGLSGGTGFNAIDTNPYSGPNTASATFTYTGALTFSNTAAQNSGPSGDLNSTFGFSLSNISAYSGAGTVIMGATPIADFSSLASFLASSGSASGYQYGSYYTIDLGTLSAGTVLTITHDDGISLFQSGTRIGSTTDGPTSAITEVVTVPTTGNTILYYGRQNGSPSILDVSVANVPEPITLSLLGTGLVGLGLVRRRNRAN